MLLISAKRAAAAIGSVCNSVSGATEPALLETLRLITPQVEAAANVETFKRGVYTDTFPAVKDSYDSMTFRLSNAFLTDTPLVLTGAFSRWDREGAITAWTVNKKMGTVTVRDIGYSEAPVTITYESGFAIQPYNASDPVDVRAHEDVDYRVYLDVPDNLASVVVGMLSLWQRNGLLVGKAVPKDVNTLIAMNSEIRNTIRSRIYGTYMRPRGGMVFPDSYSG